MTSTPTMEQRNAIKQVYTAMTRVKCNDQAALENGLVMLLCSTYFRGYPLFQVSHDTKTIPMLDVELTREEIEERERIELEEIAKQKRDADAAATEAERKVREAAAAAASAEAATAAAKLMPPVRPVSPPQPPPVHNYVPYPTAGVPDEAELLAVLMDTERSAEHSARQKRFLKWYIRGEGDASTMDELYAIRKVLTEYSRAAGFAATTDTWLLMQSVFVAILGGVGWVNLHERLLPGVRLGDDTQAARNILEALGPRGMRAIMRAIDIGVVTKVPKATSSISVAFVASIATHLKAEDLVDIMEKAPAMLMTIYYDSGNNTDGLAYIDLWKSFGWSHNNDVTSAVAAWKKQHPTMPVAVRAEILASFIPK
jgi:hypothetical protein